MAEGKAATPAEFLLSWPIQARGEAVTCWKTLSTLRLPSHCAQEPSFQRGKLPLPLAQRRQYQVAMVHLGAMSVSVNERVHQLCTRVCALRCARLHSGRGAASQEEEEGYLALNKQLNL